MSQDPLMISVSGLRGLIGSTLTPTVAARYGAAFGQWLRTHRPDTPAPSVVVGRDSRPSGQMVESAVVSGLVSVGCRVTTLGIVTTPGVAIMAEHLRADGGVVITASHNPIMWNGIKCLRHDGVAPSADQAADIIDRFKQDRVEFVGVDGLQPVTHDGQAAQVHAGRVLALLDKPAIRRRRVKVVLDSVHGAGGEVAAMLLRELGVELVHLYAEPTGRFPHEPEPTRANLAGLCRAVREHGADVGFAQDPDADRLAIVDDRGDYIGEEYTLALAALHVLRKTPGPAAANLSTSRMIDDIAGRFGCTVHRTPVGEANVAQTMRQVGAVIGGEGNGGVIWPRIIHVRDSVAGIGLVLELLADTGKKLSEVIASFPAYAIVKDKVPIRPGMAQQTTRRLAEIFADQKLDTQDGIRIDWPDRWLHVRASNTEPIMRIIAEARDEASAQQAIAQVRSVITGPG